MAKNRTGKEALPKTFDTFEQMAEFWDTHDVADYEEYLTPVEATISDHPMHQYVVTLSDSLDALLRKVQETEGVPLNTLINLWVQEKLQKYAATSLE